MRIISLLIAGLLLISCSDNSAVSKKLSGSDSLIINFKDISSGRITKSLVTTELKAIKRLQQFVAGKSTEEYKCGYNGSLLFYEKGNLVSDVSFNYAKDCAHFLLSVQEKLVSTKMSNEAADFLVGLEQGKDWY
ncbi:MAG: hypothetical protein ABIR30_08035 [Chitinophagaceae bacterium]